MTDKEKLVELIASKVCEVYSPVCDEWQPHDCGKCYVDNCRISEVADHLIAHGVTVQEWISVKDRLPKDGQSVLTCKNGVYDIQTYEERRNGWLCKGWFWSMATVTHWMPIPQPPKGE